MDTINMIHVSQGSQDVLTLTGAGDREHDFGRVPCTNTGNLAETLVSLARKFLGAPTVGNTLETMTLGDSDNVDDLILLEHGVDVDRLLKEAVCKLDLVSDGATVDLNFHEVGFLLAKAGLADLGVCKDTDDGAVFADALELASSGLSTILCMFLCVAGECLFLGTVPVLVEATLDLVGEVRRPDSGESAETTGSLDVANDTDDDQRWCLDDCDGLDDLALVHLYQGSEEEGMEWI